MGWGSRQLNRYGGVEGWLMAGRGRCKGHTDFLSDARPPIPLHWFLMTKYDLSWRAGGNLTKQVDV